MTDPKDDQRQEIEREFARRKEFKRKTARRFSDLKRKARKAISARDPAEVEAENERDRKTAEQAIEDRQEKELKTEQEQKDTIRKYEDSAEAICNIFARRKNPSDEQRQRLLARLAQFGDTISAFHTGDEKLIHPARVREELVSIKSAAKVLQKVAANPVMLAIMNAAIAETLDPKAAKPDLAAIAEDMRLFEKAATAELSRIGDLPQGKRAPKTLDPRRAVAGQHGLDPRLACAIVIREASLWLWPGQNAPGVANLKAHDACTAYWQASIGGRLEPVAWRKWIALARGAGESDQDTTRAFWNGVRAPMNLSAVL